MKIKTHDYTTYTHAKTRIRYHIVFTTKYQRKCLDSIKDVVLEAFKTLGRSSQIKIHKVNLDQDHVHLLVEIRPVFSISECVKTLKQRTTHYIWNRCENHLRRFYWKNKRVLWTHGYFCSTIGDVSEKNIIEYIENQG